eukprot:jgi/Picsp_1/1745/NSC_05217-R1_hypothetical protein CHLNCDRAFT_58549 [Chlorella variabilis]
MVNEKTRLSSGETTKEGAVEKKKSKKSSRPSPVLHLEIGETSSQGLKKSGIQFSEENSVREVTGTGEEPVFRTPCSISGISAGISSGMLGFVFGFGGYWLKERLKGTWKASMRDGWGSAKTFAVLGGLYAAVSCFMYQDALPVWLWVGKMDHHLHYKAVFCLELSRISWMGCLQRPPLRWMLASQKKERESDDAKLINVSEAVSRVCFA